MKTLYLSFFLIIVISCFNSLSYSQEVNHRKNNSDHPFFFSPKSHDPNSIKSAAFPDKSFYQQKSEWKQIIDTTWGKGASLDEKLEIFNLYAIDVYDNFCNFNTLKLNYDSLYVHYLNMINDSTSKGAFASIMARFAANLKDAHATAIDLTVLGTEQNPGVPEFYPGWPYLLTGTYCPTEHSGIVTTILPDSTTLVLRAVPNHPLHLEPGDIILGYEGVPWKNLVRELIDSGIPWCPTITGGCKSADTYQYLSGAGLNWHLFNTIDILKYAGDTVHLSLEPMVTLNLPQTPGNEQMPVKNIPFPNAGYTNPATAVTYGVMENTNIGYIFLAIEESYADQQFFEAVDSLKNTDALIIDMRWNGSGNALLNKAFDVLFNESHKTLASVYRCDYTTFDLCLNGDSSEYQINGKNPDYYDRPIAVLLGPSCWGMGEIIAHRLKYHPMVRFFGASSNGSLGGAIPIDNFNNWSLYYPYLDMYHTNDPGNYLNLKKFPIDFPVWFNKDDVAKGIDPIVEKARQWINNLAYGHSLVLNPTYFFSENDTVKATATIENPNKHDISAMLIVENHKGEAVDSIMMTPLNGDKMNVWQANRIITNVDKDLYWISLKVSDQTDSTSFTNKHMARMTNIPVKLDSLAYKINTTSFYLSPYFKSEGFNQTIDNVSVAIASSDAWIKSITTENIPCQALLPGQSAGLINPFRIHYDSSTYPGHFNLRFTVSSNGFPFWVIDSTFAIIPTGIIPEEALSLSFGMEQNYPNPFNSQSTIKWQLAKACRASLSVYDIMGRKVAVLLDEYRPAGKYETLINASTLPKGIYFYQLKAGKFIQTRKMIVVK